MRSCSARNVEWQGNKQLLALWWLNGVDDIENAIEKGHAHMGIDVENANVRAAELRSCASQLRDAKRNLNLFGLELCNHWEGMEIPYYLNAVSRLERKLVEAVSELEAVGEAVASTANQIRAEEEAERARREAEERARREVEERIRRENQERAKRNEEQQIQREVYREAQQKMEDKAWQKAEKQNGKGSDEKAADVGMAAASLSAGLRSAFAALSQGRGNFGGGSSGGGIGGGGGGSF